MNKLVLIDGNAIMHRAYHALPPFTTPDGKIVNVVYGFVSMILKIFQDLKPTHMAVAFDRPGPTFREKLFADYQIQRPKMEDDFISQIPLVHEMVAAFRIPIYEQDGFEADDVIGTIVACVIPAPEPGSSEKQEWIPGQARNDKKREIDQIIIITGDRDILQLVEDEKVLVFMPTKGISEGKLYGEKEVVERMGVKPKLIPDFKALAGDSSDNYPGVPGVGPKTAVKLLEKYKTIKHVLETLSEKDRESARVSYDLATIRTNAPITFDETGARIETIDTPEVRTKLEEFHFPSLLKRLGNRDQGTVEKKQKKERKKRFNTQQQLF